MVAATDEILAGDIAFKRAEERLREWASEVNRASTHLGMPTSSPLSVIIDRLREAEMLRKRERLAKKIKLKKRAKRLRVVRPEARRCEQCSLIYSDDVCPRCNDRGSLDQPLTADGKQTRSMRGEDKVQLSSRVLEVDRIVRGEMKLGIWVTGLRQRRKDAIFRYYMHGQWDRHAADQLDMPRADFTALREAAVIEVAEKLAGTYIRHRLLME